MRFLILGATSPIGRELAATAMRSDIEVVCLARNLDEYLDIHIWCLGDELAADKLKGVTCVIHLAHDYDGIEGAARTVASTVKMVSWLALQGVPRQIFFSSYSAGEHATSTYGKAKYEIEKAVVDTEGLIIVRPGLVVGDGGIYGRIAKWAGILPIIPLPNGGKGEVPVIDLAKLVRLICDLAVSPARRREENLFEPDLVSLAELVLNAAAAKGKRPVILPIPVLPLKLALRLIAFLHLPAPINVDNLDGLLQNQSAEHKSTVWTGPK